MSRRALLGGLALALGPRPAAAAAAGRGDDHHTVRLGDVVVQLAVTRREPTGLDHVSVHENEQTAVAASRHTLARHGGRLIELKAQRRRLVTFTLAGVPYTFDPNRIFTDVGIDKTLRLHGRYTKAAHAEVVRLAQTLVGLLDLGSRRPLVAVHNNDAGGLSVESYRPGGPLQAEAAEVWVSPGVDPDDFFLVTERAHFEGLRRLSFNVVLQHPAPTDDGSLSVYCQSRMPYLNVEARHGHLAGQIRMLEAVQALAAPSG